MASSVDRLVSNVDTHQCKYLTNIYKGAALYGKKFHINLIVLKAGRNLKKQSYHQKCILQQAKDEWYWRSKWSTWILLRLFFPSTVAEWNKLEINIPNSELNSAFKKQILKFTRPSHNSMFNVHNPYGFKVLTRLWVGLRHLREQKFKQNFQDSVDPFCNRGKYIETTIHFFPPTAQINQIKVKLFLTKLVTSNVFY